MSGPEREIEEKIIRRLEAIGFMVEWLVMRGERGWPDLTVMLGGLVVFLEVKKPGGRASANQLRKQEQLAHHGMTMLIVDDVNTAVRKATEWFRQRRPAG